MLAYASIIVIMKKLVIVILSMLSVASIAQEANTVSRPDSHAPIGVMGEHIHKKGEFMVSYRFMNMYMEDNLVGSDDISTDEIVTSVANRFGMPPTLRVTPTNMTMNMHMIGVMYAPSDWMTLMIMGMYNTRSMDHITYQGMMGTTQLGNFTTETSGLGDLKIAALFNLKKGETHNLLGKVGFNLPLGSIDNVGTILTPTNMNPEVRSPYPMQLGSGSVELNPAVTYLGKTEKISWGAQIGTTVRLNDNSEDYKLGSEVSLTSWIAYPIVKSMSASARLAYSNKGEISGIDANIALPVQTANPDFQGGTRVDAAFGVNFIGQNGFIKNQRLAIEYALPISQDLNGPQLGVSRNLVIGWQYAF